MLFDLINYEYNMSIIKLLPSIGSLKRCFKTHLSCPVNHVPHLATRLLEFVRSVNILIIIIGRNNLVRSLL